MIEVFSMMSCLGDLPFVTVYFKRDFYSTEASFTISLRE